MVTTGVPLSLVTCVGSLSYLHSLSAVYRQCSIIYIYVSVYYIYPSIHRSSIHHLLIHLSIQPSIHLSFDVYLLRACYVPGNVV